MNRYFYGTVAVVALSSFAFAQPAQSANVTFDTSMYYTVSLAIHEDDSVGVANDVHFFSTRQDGEIHFQITSKFENDLEISAHVELEAATTSDQIDESYIDVKGKFGLFRMGADDAVSEAMSFGIPSAGVPGGGVDDPTFFYSRSAVAPDTGINGIGGDSNGIRYFTPRVEGFQFGVSYQPDGEASGGNFGSGGLLGDNDSVENVFSVAANFEREFENIALKASGFYQTAEDNRPTASGSAGIASILNSTTGTSLGISSTLNDLFGVGAADPLADINFVRGNPTSYGFSTILGFGDFEIGGAWSEASDLEAKGTDLTGYGAGVSYDHGDWKVSGQWVHTEVSIDNAPAIAEIRELLAALPSGAITLPSLGKEEIDAFALEGSHGLGGGVTLGAGLYYYSIDSAASQIVQTIDIGDSYAAAVVLGLAF